MKTADIYVAKFVVCGETEKSGYIVFGNGERSPDFKLKFEALAYLGQMYAEKKLHRVEASNLEEEIVNSSLSSTGLFEFLKNLEDAAPKNDEKVPSKKDEIFFISGGATLQ